MIHTAVLVLLQDTVPGTAVRTDTGIPGTVFVNYAAAAIVYFSFYRSVLNGMSINKQSTSVNSKLQHWIHPVPRQYQVCSTNINCLDYVTMS